MSTNELLRNGSGYVDPTAYKALTAVAKTQAGVAVKPGSIWSAYFGTTLRTYYAIPALLSYKFYEDFDVQKDSLVTAELSRMWDLTLNCLGMPRTEDPASKPAKNDPDTAALRDKLVKIQIELRAAETRCIELAVARDLYRKEYRELQDRLIREVQS